MRAEIAAQRGEMTCPWSCRGAVTQVSSNNTVVSVQAVKKWFLIHCPAPTAAETNMVPAATEELCGAVSGQVFKQKLVLVQLRRKERGNGYVFFKVQVLNQSERLLR